MYKNLYKPFRYGCFVNSRLGLWATRPECKLPYSRPHEIMIRTLVFLHSRPAWQAALLPPHPYRQR